MAYAKYESARAYRRCHRDSNVCDVPSRIARPLTLLASGKMDSVTRLSSNFPGRSLCTRSQKESRFVSTHVAIFLQ
ncbi:hypothetical protein J6590_003675 [Homalodisca vitripennis]|nr:hypothetical protein J6590_003675 [Homalodisca vitripennis]